MRIPSQAEKEGAIFTSRKSESSPEVLSRIAQLEYEIMNLTQALPPAERIQMLIAKFSAWTPLTCLPLSDDRGGLGVGVTSLNYDDLNSVLLIGKVGMARKWMIHGILYLCNTGKYINRTGTPIPVNGSTLVIGNDLPDGFRHDCL